MSPPIRLGGPAWRAWGLRRAPAPPAPPRSEGAGELEGDFQTWVIALAEQTGWLAYHVADSRRVIRNRTGTGFPDLVLVHPGGPALPPALIIAELKQDGRYPRPPQRAWLTALRAVAALVEPHAPGLLHVVVWRPRDREAIRRTLRRA